MFKSFYGINKTGKNTNATIGLCKIKIKKKNVEN